MATKSRKAAKKIALRAKPAAPKPKKPAVRKETAQTPAAPAKAKAKTTKAKTAPPPRVKKPVESLDLSRFPNESLACFERWIYLACVADVFLRHLRLAHKTAQTEIKRYTPSLDELRAGRTTRPFFDAADDDEHCPYCGSPAKWHARLATYRIESGKPSDAARRDLIKSLPVTGGKFAVLEERATHQQAFFEWLDAASVHLNFDDPSWLMVASARYLGRKAPKVDWHEQFQNVRMVRRSRFLEEGWEIDNGRLFLAPVLFDELLLVQYLLSRSRKGGSLTLEGRYTLAELFARLRNAGYLRAAGVAAQNPSDAIEQLLEHLSGGETAVKFYYVVDRRDFLEKAKLLESQKPPRPKLGER